MLQQVYLLICNESKQKTNQMPDDNFKMNAMLTIWCVLQRQIW